MGELEDVNEKLGARNLEVEAQLACKTSALDLTSAGVQCTMRDLLCADARVVDEFSKDLNERCPTDDVLEAARHGDLAHLRAILYTGAPEELNVTTQSEGMSALHLAASAGHTEAVRLLLGSKKFQAINAHASKQGDRHTALHSAAAAGHEGVVRLLLGSTRFVSASARASLGHTALHLAALNGHVGVADFLLKSHGFEDDDVNAVQKNGATALHTASDHGNTNVAILLLNCTRFRKASASDWRYNNTALHTAAHWGHTAIAMALLKSPKFHTAAVNASHAAGFTALHVAVKRGHHQVALALRDSSRLTAVTGRCMEGKTAMDIARQRGDEEMISLLLSWPGAPFVR